MVDKPVENSIIEKITKALSPVHLEVINESYMHNVPKGSESHFKVIVVSKEFENVSLINVSCSKISKIIYISAKEASISCKG